MTDDFPNLEAKIRFQSKEVHEMGWKMIINKTICYEQIVLLPIKQRIKGNFWKQSQLVSAYAQVHSVNDVSLKTAGSASLILLLLESLLNIILEFTHRIRHWRPRRGVLFHIL